MRTNALVAAFAAAFLVPLARALAEGPSAPQKKAVSLSPPVEHLVPAFACPTVGFSAQLTGGGGVEAGWTLSTFGRQSMQPHGAYRSVNPPAHRDNLVCTYQAVEGQPPKQEKVLFNLRRTAPVDRPICKTVGTRFVCRAMKPGEHYSTGSEY